MECDAPFSSPPPGVASETEDLMNGSFLSDESIESKSSTDMAEGDHDNDLRPHPNKLRVSHLPASMQPSKLYRTSSYHESMAVPLAQAGAPSSSSSSTTPRAKPSYVPLATSPYSSSTNVGRFANDFDVLSLLGRGNFGQVYAVKSKMDGIDYAVKQSRRPFTGDLDRDNMMMEIRACSKLSASSEDDEVFSIVRYFSAWIEDEHIYLQMELCETSVEGLLSSNHVFDQKEIFLILRHVLLALKFLHQHTFVHLDIKPANILLKGGHFKLGDFGLARRFYMQGRVQSGVEEGDSRYLAPELLEWNIRDKDLTKCDLFSLGITGYELLTRTVLPQNGPEWHSLRSNDYALAPTKDGISQEITDLIRCLMQQDPT